MPWTSLALVALAQLGFLGASALPNSASSHVLHETRAADPRASGWQHADRLDPSKVITLRIGLRQQNLDQLEDLLIAVSHPESPTYGLHWSPKRVVQTFAPTPESVDAVKTWLVEAGVAGERLKVSASGGWIVANVTVAEAEELLRAEYHVYAHESGAAQFGCHNYSVPVHIQSHIDFIKPTVQFNPHAATPRRRSSNTRALASLHSSNVHPTIKTNAKTVSLHATNPLDNCDEQVTPDCLRALYNFHYTPTQTDKNTFGIVEFTPQTFVGSDLDLFFANFSPSLVGSRPVPVLIDGAIFQTTNQTFPFIVESNFDLAYAMTLTNPQPVQVLQTGDIIEGPIAGIGFDNWLDAVDGPYCTFDGGDDPTQDEIYPDPRPGGYDGPESCGIIPPPHTVSVSYAQDEAGASVHYLRRQCNEYGKLGLLGTSVFYASGDDGVAGIFGTCLNSTHLPDDSGTIFNPSFPSTCPYVTSVAATEILPGNTVDDPESAWVDNGNSGGGFSNVFPMPSWQAGPVLSFLRNHPPPYTNGEFNNSGKARGFPDISANGAANVIVAEGRLIPVYGTSASSPTTASMITMINDARIAAGKRPVGFINPAIYSDAFRGALNDINVGSNPGCGVEGFNATEGWDPITGVGTPNFEKLLPLFLALP